MTCVSAKWFCNDESPCGRPMQCVMMVDCNSNHNVGGDDVSDDGVSDDMITAIPILTEWYLHDIKYLSKWNYEIMIIS